VAAGILQGASLAANRSPFVRTAGKDIVSPAGEKLLLRGINLGNWLEPEGYMFLFENGPQSPREIEEFVEELIGPAEARAFWEKYRQQYITKKDVELIRGCGFNSVRLPLHYKFFLADDGAGFTAVDRLMEWCRGAGLWVVLDLHCAPGGQTGTNIDDSFGYPWLYESAEAQELTIQVWKRIARRYSKEPMVLGYDLLNEPIPHFPRLRQYNDKLEPIYKRITSAIREVDPNHIIILGGAQWDSNFKVFGKPFDPQLIYQFHKYWSATLKEVIQEYLDYRDRYNVPIWLGESGENNNQWVAQFVHTLEQNNVGWCFWPYKKMEKSSCVASIQKPAGWDEILALAKMPMGTGAAEKRIAARPTVERSREILEAFLRSTDVENCRINAGYLQALGLQSPPKN